MNRRHVTLLVGLGIIASSELYSLSGIDYYLQRIKSFFNRHLVEHVDHKEIPTTSLHSVSIENNRGPITITTGWKKKHICLKTIKRVKNHAHLDAIHVNTNIAKPHHLSIYTDYLYDIPSASVDYELIIPHSIAITLKTSYGAIVVNETKGAITAETSTGSIIIENAQGPIKAHSLYGSITIHDTCNKIDAYTKKGKITVTYKELADHHVRLETGSGNIALSLPADSHATINAVTAHGKIVSDHYITLKPYTTQLNVNAWNKLKKEVHGTIGTGQASISLSTLYGNITILESKK